MKNRPLTIANLSIQPGEKITLALPTPEIYSCARTHIPIHVIHGKKMGATLLICAAMHGDEINGIAIIQKLLHLNLLKGLSGTLIAIPVLNTYGLIGQNRSLLDHRDLESSFPGSDAGSFASRLAHLLTKEVFSLATHCIDLHSGTPHAIKCSQIEAILSDPASKELAEAFEAPIVIDAKTPRGLLWLSSHTPPVPTILFDTGEPRRIDPDGISEGVKGIVRVMRKLQMLPPPKAAPAQKPFPQATNQSTWIHSPCSGLCRFYRSVGAHVQKGELLAKVSDPFGPKNKEEIFAPSEGILLSLASFPIVNEGDGIAEIGGNLFPL